MPSGMASEPHCPSTIAVRRIETDSERGLLAPTIVLVSLLLL